MRTRVIVKREVVLQSLVGLIERVIGFGIDLLILDGSPEPLHKEMVMRSPPTIPADLNPGFRQTPRESQAGKLCSLVGVEDPWSVLKILGRC